jgi:hypothetical protein
MRFLFAGVALFLLGLTLVSTGCAPLLLAGGAAGGYAAAKDMEDGKLIDSAKS